jgi:branched-chain amino acid transport system substrate-binding protein
MTDMTPLVQKLKDAKPDVLVVISFINDTVLLHRKAKELDFNVPALIGVSAGHSVPDLKNSISTAVNGLFVSDLPVLVNPNALRPDVQAAAEEFNKRYEKVQRRVPAGHAVVLRSRRCGRYSTTSCRKPNRLRLKKCGPQRHRWTFRPAA